MAKHTYSRVDKTGARGEVTANRPPTWRWLAVVAVITCLLVLIGSLSPAADPETSIIFPSNTTTPTPSPTTPTSSSSSTAPSSNPHTHTPTPSATTPATSIVTSLTLEPTCALEQLADSGQHWTPLPDLDDVGVRNSSIWCRTHNDTGWCLPYYYIVGAQKSGSTFVHNALAMHPHVRPHVFRPDLSPQYVERHFFLDQFFVQTMSTVVGGMSANSPLFDLPPSEWQRMQQPEQLSRLARAIRRDYVKTSWEHPSKPRVFPFVRLTPADCAVTGSKHPEIMSNPAMATRLALAFPDIKVVLMVREPFSRIESSLRQKPEHLCPLLDGPCDAAAADRWQLKKLELEHEHMQQCNAVLPIMQLNGTEGELLEQVPGWQWEWTMRLRLLPDPKCFRWHRLDPPDDQLAFDGMTLRQTMYGSSLRRLMRVFPHEQIKVSFSENLFADTQEGLQNVIEFLHLPPHHFNSSSLNSVRQPCKRGCLESWDPSHKWHFSKTYRLGDNVRRRLRCVGGLTLAWTRRGGQG